MKLNNWLIKGFILIGGLILLYIVFPYYLIALPLLLIITFYFLWQKSKLIWIFLFMQPYLVIFSIVSFQAIKDYRQNEALIVLPIGHPIGTINFYDEVSRVPLFYSDLDIPHSSFVINSRNTATKLLIKLFGYQDSSYIGEWPKQEIALGYLKNNYKKVPYTKDFYGYNISLNNKEIAIQESFLGTSLSDSINVAKYKDFSCYLISLNKPDSVKKIVVFDFDNSITLAIYQY